MAQITLDAASGAGQQYGSPRIEQFLLPPLPGT
jgi:hypothetical protein